MVKECDILELENNFDKAFFTKAVDFIRNYADKFHHAKEEDILFVELCKDTVQMHCNPTSQMLFEHDLGRNFVKNMEEGLEGNDSKKVAENARGYAQMIQEHIFKEDSILYPMADEVLSAEIQESMLDRFKQVEIEFDADIKKCLSMVEEFEKQA